MHSRLGRTAGVLFAVAAASGCSLLFPGMGWPYEEPWPSGELPFPEPTVLASYTTGEATLSIDRDGAIETVTLDRVGDGSQLTNDFGASVTWRNDEGWVLQLLAYDESFGYPRPGSSAPAIYSGDVTLQLIADHEMWRTESYAAFGSRCVVSLDEASAAQISGTASCYDLRWIDGIQLAPFGESRYIEDEPPFNAEITFQARP